MTRIKAALHAGHDLKTTLFSYYTVASHTWEHIHAGHDMKQIVKDYAPMFRGVEQPKLERVRNGLSERAGASAARRAISQRPKMPLKARDV